MFFIICFYLKKEESKVLAQTFLANSWLFKCTTCKCKSLLFIHTIYILKTLNLPRSANMAFTIKMF